MLHVNFVTQADWFVEQDDYFTIDSCIETLRYKSNLTVQYDPTGI